MNDCAMYHAQHGVTFERIDLLYAMCELMDEHGNSGVRGRDVFDELGGVSFARVTDGMTKRDHYDGILFYSAGWGWRVRKSPHWRDVFFARFDVWKRCHYDLR